MFRWLLLFFIVTPIVEMYLLLTVGGYLGAIPTIGLVMLTAVIGVALLRQQGLATLTRAQERLAEGALPAAEMADGLLLAVAGPLLLTPGFLTDAMGFALLLPPVRARLGKLVAQRMFVQVGPGAFAGRSQTGPAGPSPFSDPRAAEGSQGRPDQGDLIEGDFQRKDD